MNSVEDPGGQRYGCFELKKYVGPNMLRGLVVAVLLHGMAGASPIVYRMFVGIWPGPEQTIVPKDEPNRPIPAPPRPAPPKPDHHRSFDLKRYVPEHPKDAIPVPVDELPKDVPPQLLPDTKRAFGGVDTSGDIGGGTSTSGDVSDGAGDLAIWEEPIPPIEEFIPVEVYPQALSTNPQPAYPDIAKRAGVDGTVFAQVYVDRHGDVRKFQVVRVNPRQLGFDDEVLLVIPKWKFTPAIQQGQPIGVWVTIPFKFKLGH
jgi:periplasmic protein TonB